MKNALEIISGILDMMPTEYQLAIIVISVTKKVNTHTARIDMITGIMEKIYKIMKDYKEVYDKIETMKFYLGLRENVLFVHYLNDIEHFINSIEVSNNGKQRKRTSIVEGLEK